MLAAHIIGSSTAYPTIQGAVDAAAPGATITVDPGNYAELVTVYKPLTIDGAQAGNDARTNTRAALPAGSESIITGTTGSSGVSSSFYIAANDVTIDGFIVQGATASYNYGGGIVIAPNEHGTHIVNNIVRNNFTGMLLSNNSSTDAAVIQHNVFLNNNGAGNNNSRSIYSDGGVSGGNLTNVLIDSNAFIVNAFNTGAARYEGCIALEAIAAGAQSNITISNNVMDGNGKLLLYNVNNIDIEHNMMTHSLDQWSGTFRFEGGVTNATIKYNTVFDNTGLGIAVDTKGYPTNDANFVVEYNNFYNNNSAYGNKYSMGVTETSYNGTFDATNNYWGSATGPSGQGPGKGDMAWGNGHYVSGGSTGWGTGAGDELVLSPFSTTPIGTLSTPYWGVASAAGAPIQAEDFDNGGNGNGYSTTATSNAGGKYRTGEKIGIESTTDTGGGYNVGWTSPGEWLDYTTNLAQGGTYNIAFRVATAQTTGGKFHLNIDGVNATGTLTMPATGGNQNWQTLTVNNINIAAGTHVLRLVMDSAGSGGTSIGNFNWLQLIPMNTASAPVAPSNVAASVANATTVTITWQETSTNATGFVIQRSIDGINFTPIGTTAATVMTYTDAAALSGTSYSYRVYATSAVGNSPNSALVFATTPAIATAPTSLSAVAVSSTQVNLTWTDTAAAVETGFVIQRSTDGVNFSQLSTTAKGVTSFSDTTVSAGITYSYRVEASSAGGFSPFSTAASATTPANSTVTTYLSDLAWVSATAGWNSVQKNLSVAGNALTLSGVVYAKGLGTHAVSQIVYNLNGAYTNFISDVGIDSEENGRGIGSVDFQVIGDGKVLYDSGVLTNSSPLTSLNVNVSGVKTLTLLANNGVAGTIDYDHADWAGARLLASSAQPPVAPSGLVAVAASTSQINLNWTNNSPTATGFIVQSSTDGVNFAQIATTGAGILSYSDTGLAASTTYTYRILATNGAGTSAPSGTASATTASASATVTNLSTLPWVSATAGWGTVQLNTSVVGNPLKLRGVTYSTGLGTHAASTVDYNLNGAYTNFLSDVGIDDEEIGRGTGHVDFQVIGDGKVLADTGVLTNTSPTVSLNVNVTGVQQLSLVATNGIAGDIDYDHADWAGARLVAPPPAQPVTAPLTTASRPTTFSASQIVTPALPTLDAPWINTTIGNVNSLGSASTTAGVFTVSGAGAGIGGTADSLDYACQVLAGNGTLVAHLDAQDANGEAGVSIRETLGADAKQASLVITSKNVQFIHRAKTGGKSAASTVKSRVTPQWVKMTRKGNVLTAYDSVDGKHWKKVGSTRINMGASAYIGLGVSSLGGSALNTATFSDVTIS